MKVDNGPTAYAKSGKPTKHILKFAQAAPGGVIRWSEALAIYNREANGRYKSMFPKGVGQIFNRHFTQVEGVRGFYVLTSSIVGDQQEEQL